MADATETRAPNLQDVGERRRAWLAQAQRYLVLEARPHGEPAEPVLRAALQSGCDVVQLREKSLEPAEIVRAARDFRRLCDAYDALFIVNDRPDLALVCGADGVHIELADANPPQVRRFVGEDLLIGLSTHDTKQFDAATQDAAIDYLIDDPEALLGAGSALARAGESIGKPHFEHSSS